MIYVISQVRLFVSSLYSSQRRPDRTFPLLLRGMFGFYYCFGAVHHIRCYFTFWRCTRLSSLGINPLLDAQYYHRGQNAVHPFEVPPKTSTTCCGDIQPSRAKPLNETMLYDTWMTSFNGVRGH